jgi:hypothetical protein
MSSSEQTIIPLSKGKLIRLLTFGILFIACGCWLAISQPETSNPILNEPILKTSLGILSALLGLFSIFFSLKKMKDPKPGLILDPLGFTDNTSALSAGFIPWSDVETISKRIVARQKFIVVRLKDPQNYVRQQTVAWKRKLMELNYRNYGSPINIATNTVEYEFEKLLLLFQTRFDESRNTPRT